MGLTRRPSRSAQKRHRSYVLAKSRMALQGCCCYVALKSHTLASSPEGEAAEAASGSSCRRRARKGAAVSARAGAWPTLQRTAASTDVLVRFAGLLGLSVCGQAAGA
jgi:hypothetical protein